MRSLNVPELMTSNAMDDAYQLALSHAEAPAGTAYTRAVAWASPMLDGYKKFDERTWLLAYLAGGYVTAKLLAPLLSGVTYLLAVAAGGAVLGMLMLVGLVIVVFGVVAVLRLPFEAVARGVPLNGAENYICQVYYATGWSGNEQYPIAGVMWEDNRAIHWNFFNFSPKAWGPFCVVTDPACNNAAILIVSLTTGETVYLGESYPFIRDRGDVLTHFLCEELLPGPTWVAEYTKYIGDESRKRAAAAIAEAEYQWTAITTKIAGYTGFGPILERLEEIKATRDHATKSGKPHEAIGHFVLTGNPGTGKTTAARLIKDALFTLGAIPEDKLIETDKSGLVGQVYGESEAKTSQACDSALGGVLFIDEAYGLAPERGGDPTAESAINTLVKRMEDDRARLVVIVAGYPLEMKRFLATNPGLASRFDHSLNLRDFTGAELFAIYENLLFAEDIVLAQPDKAAANTYFDRLATVKGNDFANARSVRKVVDETLRKHRTRSYHGNSVVSSVFPSQLQLPGGTTGGPSGSGMSELNALIGLAAVKSKLSKLVNKIEYDKLRGGNTMLSDHFLFVGNPGTGKTTVARLMLDIFKSLGLLPPGGILVEVDRAGLIGQYQGQTTKTTDDKINMAMGGHSVYR